MNLLAYFMGWQENNEAKSRLRARETEADGNTMYGVA